MASSSTANLPKHNSPLPDSIGVRQVMGIAWPIMVSMLSFTAMNFVNALWVGPLGKEAFAAVGIGAVVLYAIHGFGYGALTGVKIAVSQAHGQGDDLLARRLLWQGVHLAWVMGLIELLFIPLGEPLLRLLGASEAVAPLAADYFLARIFGAAPALVMTALTQYLQGRSRTQAPMVAMIVANVINVGLDPLLIYGGGPIPALGVAGAGWAASISFSAGALFLVWVAWPELTGTPRKLDKPLLARIWRLGFPLAGRATLEIASYLGFQGILAAIGDAHLAAHVLVVRTISVSFMPGSAVSEAVAVLVGQSAGARRLELVPQIRAAALRIAVSFMCFWAVVFVAFPEALASLHSAPADVVVIAIDLFIVSALFQLADAFAMVGLGMLNGAGDTRFVLYATVSIAWLTKLPLGYLLASEAGMGAVGAWWGIVFEVLVLWAVLAWRLRNNDWQRAALTEPKLATAS
jgi:multidrug resistance protein, MATE family